MFQPIHPWIGRVLIIVGYFGVIFTLGFNFYRTRKNRLATDLKDIYLTGKDIEDRYNIKPLELKQRVENGLPAYIQISTGYNLNNLRAVSERDLIACEEWTEEADGMIEQWLFKTEDVEKYIKTAR